MTTSPDLADELVPALDVPPPPPGPQYTCLSEWVEDYFAPTFTWQVSKSVRWCASWWDHPEAIIRLSVLWQLWEAAAASADQDPSAMGSWLRDWLDRLMPALTAEHGTFARCQVGVHVNGGENPHNALSALPLRPPDPGLEP
jgi:hypothetical protein